MWPFSVKPALHTFFRFYANLSRIIGGFFFLEGIMIRLSNFQYYFEISSPVEISTRPNFGEPTNKNVEKNPKFQNVLKYVLNEFWYRFRVQNASKTSQVSISSNITPF